MKKAEKRLFSLIIILLCIIASIAAYGIANGDFSRLVAENSIKASTLDHTLDGTARNPSGNTSSSAVPSFKKKEVAAAQLPSSFGLSWQLFSKSTAVNNYNRGYEISLPDSLKYSKLPGITTFRGNNYRNTSSFGIADIKEERLKALWWKRTESIDSWTGVGWNGQPAIVKWDDVTKKIMNLYPEKKKKRDLIEVIYATLDGRIYFYDLENGEPTRDPIDTGVPHKGSVTIDPRGYPLLYAGQGIDEVDGKSIDIGYRIFSLITGKMLYFINGIDQVSYRQWGAFDSNPVIDEKTDNLLLCGENGLFYSIKLNTKYEPAKNNISIQPEVLKYRYMPTNFINTGTENSLAVYKNYAFFADNGALLQCIDLNTMKPAWIRNVTDDTDSTIAVEEESNGDISLYTACEVDVRRKNDYCYIRKLNALNGELLWEKSYMCRYDSEINGGALASPVIGKNDISNLVIYNIAKTGNTNNSGKLVALEKNTGKEVWTTNLDYYCWSSPVDVYTSSGKSYLIVCDSGGYMMLIDGKTGRILNKLPLEANIEGTPAAYDNTIVVGTRGQKIWAVTVK